MNVRFAGPMAMIFMSACCQGNGEGRLCVQSAVYRVWPGPARHRLHQCGKCRGRGDRARKVRLILVFVFCCKNT